MPLVRRVPDVQARFTQTLLTSTQINQSMLSKATAVDNVPCAHHVTKYKCHGGSKHELVLGWQLLPVPPKQRVQYALIGWRLVAVEFIVIL